MKYFLDFDRTIFDTPSFKKSAARRPTILQLMGQLKSAIAEMANPKTGDSEQRAIRRMWGTFLSHGRFGFSPEELKQFLYPEVSAFLAENDCTIVTYGVEMFIRAKVTSALTDLPETHIVYTPNRKGRTIRKLTEGKEGPFMFVDDAHFQLESVGRHCPDVILMEIRRDGQAGDGRWPVIKTLDELLVLPQS